MFACLKIFKIIELLNLLLKSKLIFYFEGKELTAKKEIVKGPFESKKAQFVKMM